MAAPSPSEPPWMQGIRAARANFFPALLVQAGMVALLLAYYHHEPTASALDRLADWKARTGFRFNIVSAVLAASILPELMRIACFQKGRIRRQNFENLLFTAPFWGVMSIPVDLFYQAQERVFGAGVDGGTVAIKVFFDQFGYTAFFATPVSCVLYDWKHRGYRFRGISGILTRSYYARAVFPALIANWAVWIPLISVVYSLPGSLQFPIACLALSLWVILFTWMSETRNRV